MVVLLALAPTNAYVHCWPRARAHHRAFISGQIFPSDFGELQAESEGGDDLMQVAVRKEDEVRALLRARRLGIDIKLEWKQSVLDDAETPFWWREVDGEMEVVLTDPAAEATDDDDDDDDDDAEEGVPPLQWRRDTLPDGGPFWWRESEEEEDGLEVRLTEPEDLSGPAVVGHDGNS